MAKSRVSLLYGLMQPINAMAPRADEQQGWPNGPPMVRRPARAGHVVEKEVALTMNCRMRYRGRGAVSREGRRLILEVECDCENGR